ncbi:MAG: class I SAM-dependent methyltransferase [Planctomycetota bacterium]|jgi:SAM-dependent methyltransferase
MEFTHGGNSQSVKSSMIVDTAASDLPIETAVRPGAGALRSAERDHFWFSCRNRRILRFLRALGIHAPSCLLEIGCGGGNVLDFLLGQGFDAYGAELNKRLCEQAARRCGSDRVSCTNAFETSTFDAIGPFQAVAFFDVIEHLDEPADMLSRCATLLQPGGVIVGTVPALMGLWSSLDIISGHRIRYDMTTLRRDIVNAGLEVIDLRYFFQSLIAPIWWHRRRIRHVPVDSLKRSAEVAEEGLQIPHPVANLVGNAICETENILDRLTPLKWVPGASMLFACRVSS